MHDSKWNEVPVALVGHGRGNVDVTVLAPTFAFGARNALLLSPANVTLAEDVYFIGYPLGLSTKSPPDPYLGGYPLPLVKKAIVSGFPDDNAGLVVLDGHNNEGFSGGPVVRSSRADSGETQIIGVVRGYYPNTQHVIDKDGSPGPYTYTNNTGIVTVQSIRKVVEIIRANPIGISVDE